MSCTLMPVYWGSVAGETLSATEVQDLANTREQTGRIGTYAFVDVTLGDYLFIAMPTTFGPVPPFTLHPLNLVCIETPVVLTVNGAATPYTLYRSPDPVAGDTTLESN
jgi:hypothetical protein